MQAFLFKGSQSKQSTLDEIYIKIADIEKDRKMEEANTMFEIHKFDKKLSDMEFNYKATKEENSVLRERIKANEDNIFKFNHNLKSMKDAFLLKLSDTYEKLFEQIEVIQKVGTTADQQSKVNKAKINTMDAQILSDRKQIESHSNSLLKLESRIELVNQVTVKEQKYKEEIERIEHSIKALEVKETDFINHLATIENYVEKYLPVQIQTQVGEATKAILPQRELKKFEDSQKKIFEKINQIILSDDGVPDILLRIKQTRNLIYSGEMHMKGAMFNILNPQLLAGKNENTFKDESPPRSEDANSIMSNLKKRGTEIHKEDDIEAVKLTKHKSTFSKNNITFQKNNSLKGIDLNDYGSYVNHNKDNHNKSSSRVGDSPGRNLNNSQNEDEGNIFVGEGDSEHSVHQSHNRNSSSHIKPASSFNNIMLKEDDGYSEKEIESYLFGYSGEGDEYIPPRIETMNQADIARYIVGYIRIKDKKNRYELQLQRDVFKANIEELNHRIDYAEKEGKEYNMILHTELEQFISNKKKEFYQKFKDIVNLKEQHSSILNSLDGYSQTMKQI